MQTDTSILKNNQKTSEQKDMVVPSSAPRGFRKWAPLLVLSLALMIVIIDTTILNVSLRTIINDLHTDILGIQWVITAYSLILAAFTITGGRMGDLFGRKKMFMLGAVIFAVGSFVASISRSVSVMIAGEAIIEGIGAVLMLPATASLLVANYKGRDRAVAFGVWGGIAAASSAIGPILGGWLTSNYSWRWAFRINVGVALVLLLGSILISESRDREEKPSLDWIGVLLSSLGLLSIVYGFIKAETYGWFKAREVFSLFGHTINLGQMSIVPVFLALGLAIVGLFLLWERHMDKTDRTPLVSLALFKNKQFTAGAVTTGILALGQSGLIFSVPIFLQGVKNLDAFHTGLYMIPMSLASLVMAPLSAMLVRIMSPKRLVQLGLLVNAAAFLVLRYSLRVDATYWTLAPGFILFGLGIGLIMAQVSNITLSAVSVEEAGEASGVNNTLRQVGATLGSAILGAIMISTLTTNLSNGINQSSAIPSVIKQDVSDKFSSHASQIEFGSASAFEGNIPQNIKEELTRIVQTETTNANKTTLVYGTLFVLLGFLSSFALPGSKDVETGKSVALHHDAIAAQEEKMRKSRYKVVMVSIIVVLAVSAGTYAIVKNHTKSQNPGSDRSSASALSAGLQDSQTQVTNPDQTAQNGPSTNVKGAQTTAPSQPSPSPSTPASPPVKKPVSPRGQNKPATPTPKVYNNPDWHFSFTVPAGKDVVTQQASANNLLFFDAQSGLEFGVVQRYEGISSTDLDTVELQLKRSPDVTSISRTTFAGLPAIEFATKNSGKNIAVINNGSLYYLGGSLVSSPVSATFRFN